LREVQWVQRASVCQVTRRVHGAYRRIEGTGLLRVGGRGDVRRRRCCRVLEVGHGGHIRLLWDGAMLTRMPVGVHWSL
jgi:hypothetical protein